MTPEGAWFVQARSDLKTALLLEQHGGDTCQILMHLQMAAEKLVKGYYHHRVGSSPPFTHFAVQSYFQHLELVVYGTPRLREAIAGASAPRSAVTRLLRSLERTMRRIEALNPSVASAGVPASQKGTAPNCEYPWQSTSQPTIAHAPAMHKFGRAVGKGARQKVYRLLDRILSAEGV